MNQINENDIMKRAIEHYGISRQLDKCVEECSELITAIMKFKHGELKTVDEMYLEIADVGVTVDELIIAFSAIHRIKQIRRSQLERLESIMDAEQIKMEDARC